MPRQAQDAQILELAKRGAEHRIQELQAEMSSLFKMFPQLRSKERKGRRETASMAARAPGPAGHEFHDQVRASGTVGTVVVHARDGGVIDLRGGPCLALQAPE